MENDLKKTYIKHLIECKCILPQFTKMENPPFHKFIVFTELDENANAISSYAQCPNCGSIHKVIEIGKNTLTNKENLLSLPTIDDIVLGLPDWLVNLLKKHECELHTYQEAKFIYENKMWGQPLILAKERIDNVVSGKYVLILGETLHKIDFFEQEEGLV